MYRPGPHAALLAHPAEAMAVIRAAVEFFVPGPFVELAACRRASLDLTRILAEMRKPGNQEAVWRTEPRPQRQTAASLLSRPASTPSLGGSPKGRET